MSELEHSGHELYELGERIGRLAIMGGVNLASDEIVIALIKGDFAYCGQHSPTLTQHLFDELRSLIMLWYQLEQRTIEMFGEDVGSKVIAEQEARLRQRGFVRFGHRAQMGLTRM
ncbi:MAG: hypothetical protein HY749_04550 [Gammaproteobacteria bacterium]|nr:hypothetical protein [Gammaproteobacteria bacterium]MBI5617605.1 hypothetical protein [Gammaproteobacteria bacterium]